MRISGRVMTGALAVALLATVNFGCAARRPGVDTGTAAAQQAGAAAGRAEAAAGQAEAAAKRAEGAAGRVEVAAKRTEDAAAKVEAMFERSLRK